jgi:hypothetical protein
MSGQASGTHLVNAVYQYLAEMLEACVVPYRREREVIPHVIEDQDEALMFVWKQTSYAVRAEKGDDDEVLCWTEWVRTRWTNWALDIRVRRRKLH